LATNIRISQKAWWCGIGVLLLLGMTPNLFSTQSSTASKKTRSSSAAKKKKSTSRKSSRKSKTAGQKAPTPDRIREIQGALQREGFTNSEPNGKWDDATVEAMRRYQEKNGLNPSGKIDAPTLNKLGLGSETAGKGAPTVSSAPPASPTP